MSNIILHFHFRCCTKDVIWGSIITLLYWCQQILTEPHYKQLERFLLDTSQRVVREYVSDATPSTEILLVNFLVYVWEQQISPVIENVLTALRCPVRAIRSIARVAVTLSPSGQLQIWDTLKILSSTSNTDTFISLRSALAAATNAPNVSPTIPILKKALRSTIRTQPVAPSIFQAMTSKTNTSNKSEMPTSNIR